MTDVGDASRLLVDPDALAPLLPGAGPVEVEPWGDGHSNLTFLVRRGDQEWVLRRPPRPPYAPKAHDVLREYRMLRALVPTAVPTPEPLFACDDPGVIGAPFYVMERIDGHVLRDRVPPELDGDGARLAIAEQLVETLAAVHAVEWQGRELPVGGDGRGYLERQLQIWTRQAEEPGRRRIPEIAEVARRLAASVPSSPPPTVVHGDFKLDNVMFAPEGPPRIVAVLDWEMATVGDPLADVGFLAATWLGPGQPDDRVLGLSRVTTEEGFPEPVWLVERYAALTGRDVDAIDWYKALALWKLAVLLEGSYRRYVAGTADDPFFALLEDGVPQLAREALEVLG